MKTAIFGGSFDPPHLAHVMVCACALSRSDADRLLVIPCARHAFDKPLTPFAHRLAMCRLAVQGVIERVEVSDIEGARSGVSYMVDTLDELARLYPGDSFTLVVGSDIVDEVHRWKDFSRLQRQAPLLVVPRLGPVTAPRESSAQQLALSDISSTEIRAWLARGEMPDDLLPRRVAEYIMQHRLYGWRE